MCNYKEFKPLSNGLLHAFNMRNNLAYRLAFLQHGETPTQKCLDFKNDNGGFGPDFTKEFFESVNIEKGFYGEMFPENIKKGTQWQNLDFFILQFI